MANELKIAVLIDEIETERSLRIEDIKKVDIGSTSWFYLEGAITTLTDLLYFYYIKKED